MEPAIVTRALTKTFKNVAALSGLTLEVPAGSIFGFLGPNGAGKTTTIKILAGLARPTSGGAAVNGIPVTRHGQHRRYIGYLAQTPQFYPWMTGRETLRYVSQFYPPDRDPERHIDELLALVGMAGAADRRTKTYSGGMRQRLGIAETLVGRPPVVILDEPVSALDSIGRKDVLDLMQSLKGQTTVFYSTHILDDVERVSDHVAILDRGRLVTCAPTRELLASSAGGQLTVVVAGDSDGFDRELVSIAGVASVRPVHRHGDVSTYTVQTTNGATRAAQYAIGKAAVHADLTLLSNTEQAYDLESVFLRLVDQKEAPA